MCCFLSPTNKKLHAFFEHFLLLLAVSLLLNRTQTTAPTCFKFSVKIVEILDYTVLGVTKELSLVVDG